MRKLLALFFAIAITLYLAVRGLSFIISPIVANLVSETFAKGMNCRVSYRGASLSFWPPRGRMENVLIYNPKVETPKQGLHIKALEVSYSGAFLSSKVFWIDELLLEADYVDNQGTEGSLIRLLEFLFADDPQPHPENTTQKSSWLSGWDTQTGRVIIRPARIPASRHGDNRLRKPTLRIQIDKHDFAWDDVRLEFLNSAPESPDVEAQGLAATFDTSISEQGTLGFADITIDGIFRGGAFVLNQARLSPVHYNKIPLDVDRAVSQMKPVELAGVVRTEGEGEYDLRFALSPTASALKVFTPPAVSEFVLLQSLSLQGHVGGSLVDPKAVAEGSLELQISRKVDPSNCAQGNCSEEKIALFKQPLSITADSKRTEVGFSSGKEALVEGDIKVSFGEKPLPELDLFFKPAVLERLMVELNLYQAENPAADQPARMFSESFPQAFLGVSGQIMPNDLNITLGLNWPESVAADPVQEIRRAVLPDDSLLVPLSLKENKVSGAIGLPEGDLSGVDRSNWRKYLTLSRELMKLSFDILERDLMLEKINIEDFPAERVTAFLRPYLGKLEPALRQLVNRQTSLSLRGQMGWRFVENSRPYLSLDCALQKVSLSQSRFAQARATVIYNDEIWQISKGSFATDSNEKLLTAELSLAKGGELQGIIDVQKVPLSLFSEVSGELSAAAIQNFAVQLSGPFASPRVSGRGVLASGRSWPGDFDFSIDYSDNRGRLDLENSDKTVVVGAEVDDDLKLTLAVAFNDFSFPTPLAAAAGAGSGRTGGRGSLTGNISYLGSPFNYRLGQGRVDLTSFRWVGQGMVLKNREPVLLSLSDGVVNFDDVRLGQSLDGSDGTSQLLVEGNVSEERGWKLAILGETHLNQSLWRLPGIENYGVDIIADADISGPLAAPDITGEVDLRGLSASARVYGIPIPIENGLIRLVFDGDNISEISGEAGLALGVIKLEGSVAHLLDADERITSVGFSFSEVNLKNARGLELTTTGDIRFNSQGKSPGAITGEIDLQRVSYQDSFRVREMLRWLLSLAKGPQVLVSRNGKGKIQLPESVAMTTLEVDVSSVGGLSIETEFFTSMLSADLVMQGTLGRPDVVGEVSWDSGVIGLKGSGFEIIDGRVKFVSGRDWQDPEIELFAETAMSTRQGESSLVQLVLGGTVSSPRAAFYSTSGLADREISARLGVLLGGTGVMIADGSGGRSSVGRALNPLSGASLEERLIAVTGFRRVEIEPQFNAGLGAVEPQVKATRQLFGTSEIELKSSLSDSKNNSARISKPLNDRLRGVVEWKSNSFGSRTTGPGGVGVGVEISESCQGGRFLGCD